MFAYCGNNPVNGEDQNGDRPLNVNTMMTDSGGGFIPAPCSAYYTPEYVQYCQHHGYTLGGTLKQYYDPFGAAADTALSNVLNAFSDVFDFTSSIVTPLIHFLSNQALNIDFLRGTNSAATRSALSQATGKNFSLYGRVARGLSCLVVACDVGSGIAKNINNGASTMEIIGYAAFDTAVSAGTIYVSGKIGAVVGSYTCPGFGTVVGYGVGLFLGWVADQIVG